MRSSLWLGLMLLGCCALLAPSRAVGWGKPTTPQSSTNDAKGQGVGGRVADLVLLWSIEVKGAGTSPDEARTDPAALEQACQELTDYLKRQHPEVDWQPTVEYIQRAKLIQAVGEPQKLLSDRGNEYYVVPLRVSLNTEQLRELRQAARQHRIEQRQHLAFLALVAFSIFLVVALGYLKLEEMTRGFYTNLLRVVAVSVLILAGVGLWLLH